MSEELRKALSDILVNGHKAFDLIPLKKNREERRKIDDALILVSEVSDTLGLEAGKEVDEIIQKETIRIEQSIDDECMLISRESEIEDEDYLIDLDRIVLGRYV